MKPIRAAHVVPATKYSDTSKTSAIVTTTTAQRLWAYLTVMHAIEQDVPSKVAFEAAEAQHFLTPFTNMHLESDLVLGEKTVTYDDLIPVFFQVDDPEFDKGWNDLMECQKPIRCENNFHFEPAMEEDHEEDGDECEGHLSLYTRPLFEGHNLTTSDSLKQLYHQTNGYRIRSFESKGNCCWLIFKHRLFAGNVEKICGDSQKTVWKFNIGSVKRIGRQPAENMINN